VDVNPVREGLADRVREAVLISQKRLASPVRLAHSLSNGVKRRYAVYGVTLETPYPLDSSLERIEDAQTSLRIELVRGTARAFHHVFPRNPPGKKEPWFQYRRLPDGSEYLRWARLFEFVIAKNGRTILAHPLSEAGSLETFRAYLCGQVLSFALLKLGLESLHATAVVIQGKAVAFVGNCGEGKSTLAAACLKAGCALLTDDQLVVTPNGSTVLAYPGPPRIKLMPHIARRVLQASGNGSPLNPHTTKQLILLEPAQHCHSPVPLEVIYVLRRPQATHRRPRVLIRRLSGRAAWLACVENAFNPVVSDPPRLRQQFDWASRLAEHIPVKSLSYPRSLRALPRVVDAIAADFSR